MESHKTCSKAPTRTSTIEIIGNLKYQQSQQMLTASSTSSLNGMSFFRHVQLLLPMPRLRFHLILSGLEHINESFGCGISQRRTRCIDHIITSPYFSHVNSNLTTKKEQCSHILHISSPFRSPNPYAPWCWNMNTNIYSINFPVM